MTVVTKRIIRNNITRLKAQIEEVEARDFSKTADRAWIRVLRENVARQRRKLNTLYGGLDGTP